MKLNEIYSEESDLFSLIKSKCARNFQLLISGKAIPLYRGTRNIPHDKSSGLNYYFVQKREEPRSSATGVNIFMDFTELSPLWAKIPPRSMSNSAGISEATAAEFGDAYLIIPEDNVKSYAFMESDFNEVGIGDSKEIDTLTLGYMIYDFSVKAKKLASELQYEDAEWYTDELREILSHSALTLSLRRKLSLHDITLLSDFIEQCIEYSANNKDKKDDSPYDNFILSCNDLAAAIDNKTLLDFLKDNLNPDAYGVKVVSSYSDVNPAASDSEVWFSGGYLAIKFDSRNNSISDLPKYLGELFKEIKK